MGFCCLFCRKLEVILWFKDLKRHLNDNGMHFQDILTLDNVLMASFNVLMTSFTHVDIKDHSERINALQGRYFSCF